MATLVCFHAHPDDEAISTGGTMARAHAEGHRVVLVVATDGAHGEVPDDLAPGETLADRRRVETEASAAVLGVDRLVFLGYGDSGMTGWEQNEHEGTFHQADLDDAARHLAAVLEQERADVLTTYDWHGVYGHPDHVKVHLVGARAAELVASALPNLRVLEATMNRDEMARMFAAAVEAGAIAADEGFDADAPADDGNPFGTPEAELGLVVDVTGYVDQKRRSIRCHRSQVSDSTFFLQMPDDQFALAFGREWYVDTAAGPGLRSGWIFDTATDIAVEDLRP
jgi:LmbE family N-acetylglucosaminyl deacetylase